MITILIALFAFTAVANLYRLYVHGKYDAVQHITPVSLKVLLLL